MAITQETFEAAVQENIELFSMNANEAKEETIKQFEAQGISLANIIKDLTINEQTGKPVLNEAIEAIKKHISEKSTDTNALLANLEVLDTECRKSLPHRVLAGKNGTHDAVITLLEQEIAKEPPNVEILGKCLQALNSFTLKQPDHFDAEALAVTLKLLQLKEHPNVICLTLQWLQKATQMHEMNRQNIISAGVVKQLKPFLCKEQTEILKEVLGVFRNLVLDDDLRVEFGCAHEHARHLASEVLVDLTKLMSLIEDENLLADLFLTIGCLSVRHDLCESIQNAGGIETIFSRMKKHLEAVRLNREALKLLRCLAGNDTIKALIVSQGVAPIIKELLETHASNELLVIHALACVSTLTLRVKENSTAFFETGIAETIVEAIRLHPKNKLVQRNGAWAIRNMVSRSRNQCETWLTFGVEDLLNAALNEHPSVQQDVRAALRDLGCKVELKEEFTGIAEKKIFKG